MKEIKRYFASSYKILFAFKRLVGYSIAPLYLVLFSKPVNKFLGFIFISAS